MQPCQLIPGQLWENPPPQLSGTRDRLKQRFSRCSRNVSPLFPPLCLGHWRRWETLGGKHSFGGLFWPLGRWEGARPGGGGVACFLAPHEGEKKRGAGGLQDCRCGRSGGSRSFQPEATAPERCSKYLFAESLKLQRPTGALLTATSLSCRPLESRLPPSRTSLHGPFPLGRLCEQVWDSVRLEVVGSRTRPERSSSSLPRLAPGYCA